MTVWLFMAHAIAINNDSPVLLYQSWSSRVWQSIVSGQRFQVWNTGGDEETSSIGATWQLFFVSSMLENTNTVAWSTTACLRGLLDAQVWLLGSKKAMQHEFLQSSSDCYDNLYAHACILCFVCKHSCTVHLCYWGTVSMERKRIHHTYGSIFESFQWHWVKT